VLEATFVRSVTEGTILGKIASAQCNRGATLKVKFIPFRVNDPEIAFDAKRTVIVYFDGG
jgi:hypothetical protein